MAGSVEDVDAEIVQLGKIKRSTLHHVRELADGIYEDWVRGLSIDEKERDRMIEVGRKKVDDAEEFLINDFSVLGIIED